MIFITKHYSSSWEKQKEIKWEVCKSFRRWRIAFPLSLLWFAADLIFIGFLNIQLNLGFRTGPGPAWLEICFSLALLGIFAIPGLLILAYAMSGGRNAILARLEEEIYLEQDSFRDLYTPRFVTGTLAEKMEYTIRYDKIREIRWNKTKHRLEIRCSYFYREYLHYHMGRVKGNCAEKYKDGGWFYIYEYFDQMDQMIASLEEILGYKIPAI